MNNVNELRNKAYRRAIEKLDYNKIEKILKGIETGRITKSNFWDEIRKLTKKVYSDHSIGRWQCLSEWFYNQLI